MIDLLDPSSLRVAREAAGMSRGELAARSKVHETTIGRIENGRVDPRLSSTWGPLVRALRAEKAGLHHADTYTSTKVEGAPGKCSDLAAPQHGEAA